MITFINELYKSDIYEVQLVEDGLIIIFTSNYVIRIIGEELTQIGDRIAFENYDNDTLVNIKGIPSSLSDLNKWIEEVNNLKHHYC